MSEAAPLTHETDTERELVESRLEIIGHVSNLEEMLKVGFSDIASLSAAIDRDGNILAARGSQVGASIGENMDESRLQQTLGALGPLMQIAADHVRSKVSDDDVVQVNFERPLDRTVEDRPTSENDNRIPHVDGLRNSFGMAIGAPTIVWEGKFMTNPKGLYAVQKDAMEQFDPEEFTIATGLESGDVFNLSGPVIHQSPEGDPETWGKRRVFVTVYATPNSKVKIYKLWDDELGQPAITPAITNL